MPLSYDTSGHIPVAVSTTTTANPATGTFACGANAEALVLLVFYAGITQRTGGSPTFGTGTFIQAESLAGVTEASCEIWYMEDPPNDATYLVSIPNANGRTLWANLVSINASATFEAKFHVSGINETTAANPNVSVTPTVTGTFAVAGVATGDNTFDPTAQSGTEVYNDDPAAYGSASQYYSISASGTTSISWTEATSDDYGALAVVFYERAKAITVSLDAAQLSASGQSITVDSGGIAPTTVNLDAAQMTSSGFQLDVSAPIGIIIEIDHEEGDLSEYSSTYDPDNDLTVTGTAALANSNYGLECRIDDATAVYGLKTLSTPNTTEVLRYRFYFDPNSLYMSNTSYVFLVWNYADYDAEQHIQITRLHKSATSYQIQSFWYITGSYTGGSYNDITDDEHYIEVMLTRASAEGVSDGTGYMWIDKILVDSQTALNNYPKFTQFKTTKIGNGFVNGTVSGTFYLDEFVFRDDDTEIGAKPTTISLNIAQVAVQGQDITVDSGGISPTTINLNVAQIVAYGQIATPSIEGGPTTINLDVAQLGISGPQLDIYLSSNHYVSNDSGNDDWDGTEGQPWKTISKVNAHTFVPGDCIYFKRSEIWREVLVISNSGNADVPITYGAYGTGSAPSICGSDIFTSWTNHAGNVWKTAVANNPQIVIFDGVVGNSESALGDVDSEYDFCYITGTVYVYSAGGDPNTVYTDPGVEIPDTRFRGIWTNDVSGVNYITLQDIRVYGVGRWEWSKAIETYNSSNWTFSNVTIEKCGSFAGIYTRGATYNVITGCTITGERELPLPHAFGGINFNYADSSHVPAHNIVTLSDITYCSGYGVSAQGWSYEYRADYIEISYNDLSHDTTGCYLMECDHCTVNDNTCDDNVVGGTPGEEQYGIAFETVSNSEVYNNTCTNGVLGMEIWSGPDGSYPNSGDSHNNKIHHNVFANNSLYGFYVYTGNVFGTELHTNLVYGNGYDGIGLNEMRAGYESTGCYCYNNTLYENATDDTDRADFALTSSVGNQAGWTVKNNIAYNVDRACLRTIASPEFIHTNNCYYRETGTVINKGGTTYDLEHVVDFEATAVAADPSFIDAGNNNFELAIDSPCINAGVDVGLTEDFNYHPIVGNPDIGAYEFGIIISLDVSQITIGGQSITISAIPSGQIDLDVAILTLFGQVIDIQPGEVEISLDVAEATTSGPDITISAPAPGTIQINLSVAQITSQGQTLDVQPGAVSISLDVAQVTISGLLADIQPGAVSISLDAAQVATTGQSFDVQPGAVSISLDTAQAAISGQDITVSTISGLQVNLDAAQITVSGRQIAIQGGAVTTTLDTALLYAIGGSIAINPVVPPEPAVCIPAGGGGLLRIKRNIVFVLPEDKIRKKQKEEEEILIIT